MSEELRLTGFLRQSESGGEIEVPEWASTDEVAEICAGDRPETLQYWQRVIQHHAQGERFRVLTLQNQSLFDPDARQMIPRGGLPAGLRQWLELVRTGKQRQQTQRIADEAAHASNEVAKRLALEAEASEQAARLEAERVQKLFEVLSDSQTATHASELEHQRQRDRCAAAAVVALLEERGLVAVPPAVSESEFAADTQSRPLNVTGLALVVPLESRRESVPRELIDAKTAIRRLDELGFRSKRSDRVAPMFLHPERYGDLFRGGRDGDSDLWDWFVLRANFERHGIRGRAGMGVRRVDTPGGQVLNSN